MIDVKEVLFERNGKNLILSLENEAEVFFQDVSRKIEPTVAFNYLSDLMLIIDNWQNKYIDYSIIDGEHWKLVIIYLDGSKKEFVGKGCFPNNFEAVEKINQKLTGESYV